MPESDNAGIKGADLARELAASSYAQLLRYALGIAGSEALARDAVQESFLRLMNESLKGRVEHPRAWLFRVCRNRILDELKREGRHFPMDESPGMGFMRSEDPQPSQSAEKSDAIERAMLMAGRLRGREREAVRLKFQCGFSYAQIAQIMSLSESNVGVILHGALRSLRGMFFDESKVEPKHS